jgi:STE24 endopeptidase
VNEDKSARYHKRRRRAAVASVAWSSGLLAALAFTPAAVALREFAQWAAGRLPLPAVLGETATIVVLVLALGCLHESGALPISFYRSFLLEHRFGLSRESAASWIRDQAKGLLLSAAFSSAGFAALYLTMRLWPSWWWLAAGAGFAAVTVVLARLAPVVLLPIFFSFRPLGREDLRQRLISLSRRAGVPVLDACEWRLSDRTKKANAALTGLGRTRRILVSDTLLAHHGDDEIEAILAHEMGHHVHGDIWKGIAVESLAAVAGFFLISRVLDAAWRPLGWRAVSDPAGLPVVVLTAGLLSLALLPLTNWVSRLRERAADRFACELTGNPAALASALERLASQNLAERRPPRLAVWLFQGHPPVDERIAAALSASAAPRDRRASCGSRPRP